MGVMVMLTASWLLGVQPTSPIDEIACHHDKLSRLLDQHQIRYRQWTISDGRLIPAVDVEQATAGCRWRQTITHFGPGFASPELARSHDPRRNHTFVNETQHILFWEKRREAWQMSLPALPATGLNLGEHTTKVFLTSALLRPHIDRPLDVFAAAEPKAYRCRWRDLMLPEALRQPGWVRVEPGERPGFPGLHLRRAIVAGFSDDLWLDPARGHAITHREFSFGPDQRLIYEYDDLAEIAVGFWLPMTCRWLGGSGHRMEEKVTSIQIGPPPEELFVFHAPPGTKTVDKPSGRTTFEPGGEDMLAEVVATLRSNFCLPKRPAPLGPAAWQVAGLVAALMVAGVALLAGRGPGVRSWRAARRGLTLVELLVVLSIIGLLVALLLPAVQDARRSGARLQCQNNQRQIGLGLHQYAEVHGQFPAGQLAWPPNHAFSEQFRRSGFVAILPYMDQAVLYGNFNFSTFEYDLANITVEVGRPGWLVCPSDPETAPILSAGPDGRSPIPDPPGGTYPVATTSYGLVSSTVLYNWSFGPWPVPDPLGQLNGCFNLTPDIGYAAITDGLSHTLFAGERALGFVNRFQEHPTGRWTRSLGPVTVLETMVPPNEVLKGPPLINRVSAAGYGFSSFHAGGVNMLFGDGSVRFIKDSIDCWPINPISLRPGQSSEGDGGLINLPPEGVWQALTTRAGGEVISGGDF